MICYSGLSRLHGFAHKAKHSAHKFVLHPDHTRSSDRKEQQRSLLCVWLPYAGPLACWAAGLLTSRWHMGLENYLEHGTVLHTP